ncbi:hypothetical protein ISN45_Aa07g033930 [Arabidopsis thaliana x Arabidopsis arenosa]|uniref:Uncharacterized protein n=1 Tax=Arabidopsis thaliana x Arabidopsis arenosa TaxID=1240361 RepID=A0A8T1YCL0_9BRAS|nr:hypothetical protein ISN45_Aa07g033930 [Arabidopsis thaliana x Arabidopsis arenosa]
MAGENPQPRTKFIHIVASLEQVLDLKRMGFEDIVGRLLEYEERVGGSFGGDSSGRGMGQGRSTLQSQGGETGDHNQKQMKDLSKVMRQGLSASSCLEISKPTCLQAEGLAEGHAGEGHEEDDVMEDITQDNHEDEVGEVVQGVPQLTRSGRQVNQPQYLEDYVLKSKTVSDLFQQAYVESERRAKINKNKWFLVDISIEVFDRYKRDHMTASKEGRCRVKRSDHGTASKAVVEVVQRVLYDVIQGAEQEGCVQGIVEVVQALVQEVIQGAEHEGDAQGMLVDTKMQSNLKMSNLKISKAKEEQEIVSQQRLKLRMFKLSGELETQRVAQRELVRVAQAVSSCSSAGARAAQEERAQEESRDS